MARRRSLHLRVGRMFMGTSREVRLGHAVLVPGIGAFYRRTAKPIGVRERPANDCHFFTFHASSCS